MSKSGGAGGNGESALVGGWVEMGGWGRRMGGNGGAERRDSAPVSVRRHASGSACRPEPASGFCLCDTNRLQELLQLPGSVHLQPASGSACRPRPRARGGECDATGRTDRRTGIKGKFRIFHSFSSSVSFITRQGGRTDGREQAAVNPRADSLQACSARVRVFSWSRKDRRTGIKGQE